MDTVFNKLLNSLLKTESLSIKDKSFFFLYVKEEDNTYYVWCCAPIIDEKNKVHVFYSRWEKKYEMKGWLGHCEIAHAVADQPEGP